MPAVADAELDEVVHPLPWVDYSRGSLLMACGLCGGVERLMLRCSTSTRAGVLSATVLAEPVEHVCRVVCRDGR